MPKNNKGERNKRGSGTRMKREYVKPVIESEEFVANEYVAGCYIIKCKAGEYDIAFGQKVTHEYHGSFISVGDKPNPDYYDQDGDGFVKYLIPNYGDAYSGEIGGEKGPHPVDIIDNTKPGHPNASV